MGRQRQGAQGSACQACRNHARVSEPVSTAAPIRSGYSISFGFHRRNTIVRRSLGQRQSLLRKRPTAGGHRWASRARPNLPVLSKLFFQFLQVTPVRHHQHAVVLFKGVIAAGDDRFLTAGYDDDAGLSGQV